MNLIIYTIILHAYMVSFLKLFPLAGRKTWEAIVPGYNLYVWLKIIKKPWWWLLLLIFPGVNVLMMMVMSVNLAIVFNQRTTRDSLLAIFLPFIYFPKMAFVDKVKYVGPIDRTKIKRSSAKEWGDAIIFAIIAASIIRTYFMEAFTIPTGSMEKTMLIGDYLFVSKVSYGPRIPNTPLSFPFAHHTLPLTNAKSYLDWMDLPYYRLPGMGEVERNDVVVFNYPEGDTVTLAFQSNRSYNAIVRHEADVIRMQLAQQKRTMPFEERMNLARKRVKDRYEITVRPVDKRENYIKRCVALPGDKLQVREGVLFVNEDTAYHPPQAQLNYRVFAKGPVHKRMVMRLKDELDINLESQAPYYRGFNPNNFSLDAVDFNTPRNLEHLYLYPLTDESRERLDEIVPYNQVLPDLEERGAATDYSYLHDQHSIFPNVPEYDWTRDNFGPIDIPQRGASVELTLQNLPIYERVITIYEGHELEVREGKIFIDGAETSSYTFAMDYYWLMGDNRHNSADSRFWGFVPEDHVVGKAVFVWLSLDPEKGLFDGKIRWDRMFRSVK